MDDNKINDLAEQFSNDCLEYCKNAAFESLSYELAYQVARNNWTFRKLAELQLGIDELKNNNQ